MMNSTVDTMTHESLSARMLGSTTRAVKLQLEIGYPLPEALKRARANTCAGGKVWEQVERNFAEHIAPHCTVNYECLPV